MPLGLSMGMVIFNTMEGKKVQFETIAPQRAAIFVCGPTVYDYPHVGHARAYVMYDIIAKTLMRRGYGIDFLMNITDVDDKIIKRAAEAGEDPMELARRFEEAFYGAMKALGIDSVTIFARASENISEIENQIARLINGGYAYVTETGIYYDITRFENYGALSHQNAGELNRHRIEPDATKRHPQDFALWKVTPADEVPKWTLRIALDKGTDAARAIGDGGGKHVRKSNEGVEIVVPGRPGWHIEDTAMAEKYLGQQYDIHGGGQDLVFPHHESEIAQMESISGKVPFVRYWMHTGFLTIDGKKMSKSLKNFVKVQDVLARYDSDTLRLFFASSHYRSPMDYSSKGLDEAKAETRRLYNTVFILRTSREGTDSTVQLADELRKVAREFEAAMDDDFNTPDAVRALFAASSAVNRFFAKHASPKKEREEIERTFLGMANALGILMDPEARIPDLGPEAAGMIKEREKLRKNGMFADADRIRDKLKAMGLEIEDSEWGTIVRGSGT
jgi:cysteinyl-tRNA synthetase